MLTVNILTKKDQIVVSQDTFECSEVRLVAERWHGEDGKPDEHPGVYIYLGTDGNHRHIIARSDDLWYQFFVVNEAGKTVNSFTL